MRLEKSKNDWAKVVRILIHEHTKGVSMAIVLNNYERNFYKFQSRLGEVAREHPTLKVYHSPQTYVSKMDGKTKHFTQYIPLSPKKYLINLFNKLNRQGLKK